MKNRIKKFTKDNKKVLIEIAGFAFLELCAIGAYTIVCKSYGYKMVKPYKMDGDGNIYFKGVLGDTFHLEPFKM